MKLVPARALLTALVALVCAFAFTASAQAFSIPHGGVTVTTEASTGAMPDAGPNTAGAHPNQTTTIDFGDNDVPNADSARDLQIHFGPGIVAYVNNAPRCSAEQWGADDASPPTCDADTQIGETSTTAGLWFGPVKLGPVTLPGQLYNIDAPAGSPAEFGLYLPSFMGVSDPLKLLVPITVDPHDLGLTATLSGLPSVEPGGFNVHIETITQTLYGYVGGRPFFTNPTSCVPAAVTITAKSQAGATSSSSDSYTPTDCAGEPFGASLTTAADPATADSTSAISFDVQPSADTETRIDSHVRSTTVIAPPGVLLNPALAARLDACTDAGFARSDTAVATDCPASSAVGSIDFRSPILGDFPGTVYFGTQTPSDRLRLFLDVPLFGAHIKLSASVNPDLRTGQVTTVFSDLPQIAFTDFRLTFRGGPQSALVTPTTCGESVATAIVGPWSGGPTVQPQGSFTTTDCNRAFTPSMATQVSTSQAGASTGFTLSFERPDRTVPVGSVAFSLPPGLLGDLALPGMTKCALPVAAINACPDTSKAGSVRATIGSGDEPPTLPGQVYLTEPKQPSDIAGLSIVVPAKLGPVDAGTVIVNERLVLANDGHLDVISDAIPALQDGIPLAIRRLVVTIDRDGFMRNPTSCGTKQASGTFTPLDGGPDASASSTLDINGCDRVPFAPQITATISGNNALKIKSHPALAVSITQAAGQAAMRTAVVTLPRSLAANLETLKHVCDPSLVASFRCPRPSYVGTATAVSPLIDKPLTGQVHLVRVGTGLPKLVAQLRGEASIDLDGPITITRSNQLVTTFPAVPDISLSRFTLSLRGPQGVLTTIRDICAQRVVTAAFTGQNGGRASARPSLGAQGCKPIVSGSLRMRRGRATMTASVSAPTGAKPFTNVRLALPTGLELRGAHLVAKASGKRLPASAVRAKGGRITLSLPANGAANVSVSVSGIRASFPKLARRLAARNGPAPLVVGTLETKKVHQSKTVQLRLR
ncbi:MAG TPA: hypothetical protein VGM91_09020 [Conexibacter sp.]|jgi:hypothetical protein